jgi:hypothetical protein
MLGSDDVVLPVVKQLDLYLYLYQLYNLEMSTSLAYSPTLALQQFEKVLIDLRN